MNKSRITPRDLARHLKISSARFNDLVSDGQLPKGRIGEDGRRYYTQQDLDFIMREWKTQTTGRFLMYTLPLLLILVILTVLTVVEIRNKIEDSAVQPTPTVPSGYGALPAQYYESGTPLPTAPEEPIPSPLYSTIEEYRRQMREENLKRERQRSSSYREDLPPPVTD